MNQYNHLCAIGDSHVGIFSPYCRLSTLGPATMYSLTTDKLYDYINYLLDNNEIDYNSWWIFCVGEIDIRCLFYKQIYTYNRNEDEVISSLVDNYIKKLQTLNYTKIIVCNTVAPARTTGYEEQQKYTINSEYPFIGSDSDRNRWAQNLNSYLTKYCKQNNVFTIDLYNLFKDNDGFLDQQYIDADMIHVAKNEKIIPILQTIN